MPPQLIHPAQNWGLGGRSVPASLRFALTVLRLQRTIDVGMIRQRHHHRPLTKKVSN